VVVLLAAAVACRSEAASADGETGGTLIAVLPSDPGALLPIIARQIQDKMVIDQIFEPLAMLAGDLNTAGDASFQPRLAERWTWAPDSLSIAFHLNPRARWHDGVPVRAADVRFTYQLATDTLVPSNLSEQLQRIDSVSTPDSLTAVFWYRRRYPEQFYDATYNVWIVPEHLLKDAPRASLATSPFNKSPVGTGRFRFVRWEPGSRIELIADTANYRGRPKLDRIVWSIVGDPNAKLAQLGTHEVDAFDLVTREHLAQLGGGAQPASRVSLWPGMAYSYIVFNRHEPKSLTKPHPILDNLAIRTALAMALDRAAMVRSVFDSLAVPSVGPMARSQSLADSAIAQPAFDTVRAAALLDSLGWKRPKPDAIRMRNGKPLRLGLVVPTPSAARVRCATIAQEAWRRLGVQVDVEQVEGQVYVQRLRGKDFDMIFHGVTTDPSIGGVRSAWSSATAAALGTMNGGGWAVPGFDAHLDSALNATQATAARAHSHEAYASLMRQVPAIWVYEQRNSLAISSRFKNVQLQPNGWWQGIADWTIPAAERLPRDRIGLATKAR
jgi:peptide/nickel transport system substrate-binding protein